VAYKLAPASGGGWAYSVIHTFTGGVDGDNPFSSLAMDGAGNLYGTSSGGGNLKDCQGYGCGVVFELSPPSSGGRWQETSLHIFTGGADGSIPFAPVTLDSSGTLYGAADEGGNLNDCNQYAPYGCGVVFKIVP
jgi:uncharacterized repeat protein (TIGR03803 family)